MIHSALVEHLMKCDLYHILGVIVMRGTLRIMTTEELTQLKTYFEEVMTIRASAQALIPKE